MKLWITPTNGTRAPPVLPIGVRQHAAYQRCKPRGPRRTQPTRSRPVVRVRRHGGIWKMSVPPAASSTSGRSRGGRGPPRRIEHVGAFEEAREGLTVRAIADQPKSVGRRDVAGGAAN